LSAVSSVPVFRVGAARGGFVVDRRLPAVSLLGTLPESLGMHVGAADGVGGLVSM
jgi:hypothetical protein